jgi:hypothetical protein
MQNIFDLSLLAELEKAAPKVTTPSWETHQAVVKALVMFASANKAQNDVAGVPYWRSDLDEIIKLTGLNDISPNLVGRICRNFRLFMKRENDGYKAAWSEKQLVILKKAFILG